MNKREHNWTKEDAIITLFYSEFGTAGLLVTDEKELAESVIGSSLPSLKMMVVNYTYLKDPETGFCNVSENQREVFDSYYNKISKDELKDIVNDIILNRDLEQNKEEYKAAKKIRDKQKAAKEKSEKLQAEMYEMWRRMGKDPNKMRKVVA